MPFHIEDLPFILEIQESIAYQINLYITHNISLCGDFIRDIALIGSQDQDIFTLP
jgi:hypothetical protein